MEAFYIDCEDEVWGNYERGEGETANFWNIRGVILVHFTPRGVSVTTVACQAPLQDLVEAIRLQGPGVLTRRVLLIYNNARPHTARCTIALPDIWLWERVPRPQCNLDLTPSNFYVFDERKKTFPRSDDTVKAEAQKCLREQDVSFYRQSSQNVILHYDTEQLISFSDYVEK